MQKPSLLKNMGVMSFMVLLLSAPALGSLITSGDLTFDDDPVLNSGSGRLDIILFTGNAVSNPSGVPDPNGALPGGGSTFDGYWPVASDAETFTVGEALDYLHASVGAEHNELVIFLDTNEPGSANKKTLTIDAMTITVGSTSYSTAAPVVLDGSNGSGYSDYVIRGVGGGIDLTTFDASDLITARIQMSDLDGGFEEFFLGGLPEPTTMVFLGLGLAAINAKKIVRKTKCGRA